MKNFLFISINEHVSWGGSEVLWSRTAQELSVDNNVKILIKKWEPEPKPIKELKVKDIKVFYKFKQSISFKRKLINKIFKIKQRTRHHLEQDGIGRPDLVVISLGNHLEHQLFYYTDYLKRQNISYIIIFQLVTDLRSLIDSTLNRFRSSFEEADKLYFLSKDNVDKAELQFSTYFLNKELINNPFDFNANYIPLDINNDDSYFLGCVASLNSLHKGIDVLLKVLSTEKWKKRPLYVNVYGDGPNKNQIERLINLYNLEDKVFLIGYVSNKAEIWKKNHGLILPSRMEGQSLAMLEAMSYGRMVISTKVGDAIRLVLDNESGFLIDALSYDLLDNTLERAWKRRKDWTQLGQNSRVHLFNTIESNPVSSFSKKLLKLL